MRRYPGHVLPVADFTGETLGEGSDLLEWGTPAFSVMACKRPLYLQVSHRPQRSHRMVCDRPSHALQHYKQHCTTWACIPCIAYIAPQAKSCKACDRTLRHDLIAVSLLWRCRQS